MDNIATLRTDTETSPIGALKDTNLSPEPLRSVETTAEPQIPAYLHEIYHWAYLNPKHVKLLDHEFVVKTILWQQHNKLKRAAKTEIVAGQSLLQAACVYGDISIELAEAVGPSGRFDIADVALVQVENARRKLKDYPQATVHHANIMHMDSGPYDVVCCYFLLHEVPDNHKEEVINVLLEKVDPGGKVVFVDYNKPHWAHPLKPITSFVFDTLEPFAKGLWKREIKEFAHQPEKFAWRKERYFGGLFQKVVAERID